MAVEQVTTAHRRVTSGQVREFTVAVFVVHEGRVLLHRHKRLGLWLPPGGHIDEGELPDQAAVRETLEETGVDIELVEAPLAAGVLRAAAVGEPERLVQPLGIQLEDIAPGHQHIDLVYAARLRTGGATVLLAEVGAAGLAWYAPDDWSGMGVTEEVSTWARAAIAVVDGVTAA